MSATDVEGRTEPKSIATRVLIVAGDEDDASLLTQLLEWTPPFDAEVSCVANLGDALKHIAHASPALVLLDLALPDSPGIDAVTIIRAHVGDTPIVLLSSPEDEDQALHAMHLGAQDYLLKGQYGDGPLIRTLRLAQERNAILTELRRARRNARHTATHDVLTGLPNRQRFRERLQIELERIEHTPTHTQAAVLVVSLDRFKAINDHLGHAIGDELLRTVGKRLTQLVGGSDTVARVGGDEFGLLLTNIDGADDAVRVAQLVIATLRKPALVFGHSTTVSPSIGIAMSSDASDGDDAMVRCADLALRTAKSQRTGFELYHEPRHRQFIERRAVEHTLSHDIDLSQLFVHYQPQVDSTTGELIGIEALVRWNHASLGSLLPDRFIDIAEETGSISVIGRHVLHTACHQLVEWHRLGHDHLTMSVNASIHELMRPEFAPGVEQILIETGLDPRKLVIEVTERTVVEQLEAAIETLCQLRALGVSISLDDFGRGASSLHALANLPKDEIKIDQSFISRCTIDDDSDSIITAILFMARQMGLRVIAEGVEKREQLDFLTGQGCTRLQGFYFSRPLAAHQLTELLSTPRKLPTA